MMLLDEMLSLNLLTADQHHEIGAWVRQARTPERILQMPPTCGRCWSRPACCWTSTTRPGRSTEPVAQYGFDVSAPEMASTW